MVEDDVRPRDPVRDESAPVGPGLEPGIVTSSARGLA